MTPWTHLIRFIAHEDQALHIGQLVDTTRDAGKYIFDGVEVKAYLVNGNIFNGTATSHVYTVERLLSPVAHDQCTYIRCLGLNYHDHSTAGTNINCAQDGTSDYEAELCAVVGKSGRDIPEEEALNYVLGYTASNDVSARQLQLLTAQWSFTKGLDGSCPIGPVLVSPCVIPDPQTLQVKAIYNGQAMQDGQISDMIFNLRKQISYLSQGTTLEAGTLILTGTPAGIGYFRTPRVVLQDGDDIRIEVPGIGTLVNFVRYDSQ